MHLCKCLEGTDLHRMTGTLVVAWGRRAAEGMQTLWEGLAELIVSIVVMLAWEHTHQNSSDRPGTVAHACNPSTLGGLGMQIT